MCLPSSYSASRFEKLVISSPFGFEGCGHWALLILVMTAWRDIRGHRMARAVPLRRLFHVEILNPHPSWKGMGLNGRGYSRVMDSATDSDAACLRCWSRIRGEGSGLGFLLKVADEIVKLLGHHGGDVRVELEFSAGVRLPSRDRS